MSAIVGHEPAHRPGDAPSSGSRLDVLLVNPALTTLTAIPPLGVGYLAAATRRAGHSVQVLDLSRGDHTLEQAVSFAARARPRIVGFSVLTPSVCVVQRMVPWLRREVPSVVVVLGGPHVSALPVRSAREMGADYAFRGEAEEVFPRFVDRVLAGEPAIRLPGVARPEQSPEEESELERPVVQDLDSLPFPSWDLIEPASYPRSPQLFYYRGFPIASVLTSRGCPYQCSFCATMWIHGFELRRRSAPSVVDEIELLTREHGVREINITDDNFTYQKDHAMGVCTEILRRGLRIPWKTPNGVRIDSIDEELVRTMKAAGCYQLAFGIESGSQEVLDRNLKHLDLGIVVDRLRLVKRNGLETAGFFIFGLPGETERSVEQTLRFAARAPLDYAHFSVCLPLPGSIVFDRWQADEKSEFLEHPCWERFLFFHPFATSTLDATYLQRSLRRALWRFYRHPRRIWKVLSRVKPRQYPMLVRLLLCYGGRPPRDLQLRSNWAT